MHMKDTVCCDIGKITTEVRKKKTCIIDEFGSMFAPNLVYAIEVDQSLNEIINERKPEKRQSEVIAL